MLVDCEPVKCTVFELDSRRVMTRTSDLHLCLVRSSFSLYFHVARGLPLMLFPYGLASAMILLSRLPSILSRWPGPSYAV